MLCISKYYYVQCVLFAFDFGEILVTPENLKDSLTFSGYTAVAFKRVHGSLLQATHTYIQKKTHTQVYACCVCSHAELLQEELFSSAVSS